MKRTHMQMTLVKKSMWFRKITHAMILVVVLEKNTHARTLVDPYVVCEKNKHAMTPAVVNEKNIHAMTLVLVLV